VDFFPVLVTMYSKLTQAMAQGPVREASNNLFDAKARKFYLEICRCLPFIHKVHKVDDLASVREMRAMVKEKFMAFRDVKDPRVRAYTKMHYKKSVIVTDIVPIVI
jgi:hypothetical protein